MSTGSAALRTSQTTNAVSMEINQQQLGAFLESLESEYDDFYFSWLKRIGAWVLREALVSFDNQKQKGGKRYARLSTKYAALKKRKGKSPKANFWSGALRRSLLLDIKGSGLKKESHVGSNVFYAGWIQKGTMRGGKPCLPERPYLPTVKAAESEGAKLADRLMKTYVQAVT